MEHWLHLFSPDNILFFADGKGVCLLELLTTVLGLTSVLLASLGKPLNFWIGYIYSLCLFGILLQNHLYANMGLSIICLGINIYGLWKWTHPQDGGPLLKATYLGSGSRWLAILFVGGFTLIWGLVLSRLHDWTGGSVARASQPFLDSFGAGCILLAQWLSAKKKWECWWVWLVVNGVNIILYLRSGLIIMPFMSLTYIIFNIMGIAFWRKEAGTA